MKTPLETLRQTLTAAALRIRDAELAEGRGDSRELVSSLLFFNPGQNSARALHYMVQRREAETTWAAAVDLSDAREMLEATIEVEDIMATLEILILRAEVAAEE